MENIKENSGILKFLYNTVPGRMVLKLITCPTISKIGGAYMDSRISKIHIKGFIKNNGIDMSQYEKVEYKCFNECFTRKILAEKRPVDMEENALISPCDGRLSAYRISENSDFYMLEANDVAKRIFPQHLSVEKREKQSEEFRNLVRQEMRL